MVQRNSMEKLRENCMHPVSEEDPHWKTTSAATAANNLLEMKRKSVMVEPGMIALQRGCDGVLTGLSRHVIKVDSVICRFANDALKRQKLIQPMKHFSGQLVSTTWEDDSSCWSNM
ncbi:hypothetical protein JOB18_047727 [Solea senegalensis]|uniref:Uncharacterized protein n=1 Tax=Solea senegalensis TaxID=28829 RepID=A0AAV6PM11_SOLSE|nr:hypothetical protein JOB18_047727 [Solea senegalensis]